MTRLTLLFAFMAGAAAFQGLAAVPQLQSKMLASRVAPCAVSMQEGEPSEKATIIGAASVGGILGVYLFHDLSAGVLLAAALAYGATLSNSFGTASKTAGSAATKAFTKAVDVNEQYDLLPKAKSALDAAGTTASNLNENYGLTAKIDETLQLSAAVEKASSKVKDLKSSVDDKLSEIKAAASTTD